MKRNDFNNVLSCKIELVLKSFLHIGGESEENFELCTNGNGQYIIPATGIAGVVRNYIVSALTDIDESQWFGDSTETGKGISKIFFYDAICENCNIEKRVGICVDNELGVAKDGLLHEKYYLGSGMNATILIQFFLMNEDENEKAEKILENIVEGLQCGKIRMGSKKTDGAGRFQVRSVGKSLLNLSDKEDLNKYLEGVFSVFNNIDMKPLDDQSDHPEKYDFSLKAYIPNGLLVKSGIPKTVVEKETSKEISCNMEKTVLDESGDEQTIYYIPGSTIKGAVRGYAAEVCDHLGITPTVIDRIFGTAGDKDEKYSGSVYADDVNINDPQIRVYNRVKIDRWLGSATEGALFSEEIISSQKKRNNLFINVNIDKKLEKQPIGNTNMYKAAYALVFLALRDMGLGVVPIGSGNSVGYGRLKGRSLCLDGVQYNFKEDHLECSEKEDVLTEYLSVLGGIRDED